MKKIGKLHTIAAVAVLMALGGCAEYYEVPAGYVGKVLTPTGWEDEIRESGQVDLSKEGYAGRQNVLVLLEATTTTVKEQYLPAESSQDGEDHRVMTREMPLSVDVYVRAMVPSDDRARNNIFLQITPNDTGDSRVKKILVQDIYDRFAGMDVRGGVREIFTGYDNWQSVIDGYAEINSKISARTQNVFEENGVPLDLQNAQISNVKPDEVIWSAQNRLAAAESRVDEIEKVGEALRENPGYVQVFMWERLPEVVSSGQNTLILIPSGMSTATAPWAAAEYLKGEIPKLATAPSEKRDNTGGS